MAGFGSQGKVALSLGAQLGVHTYLGGSLIVEPSSKLTGTLMASLETEPSLSAMRRGVYFLDLFSGFSIGAAAGVHFRDRRVLPAAAIVLSQFPEDGDSFPTLSLRIEEEWNGRTYFLAGVSL